MTDTNFHEGRKQLFMALRQELVGPSPAGKEFDTASPPHFADDTEARGPWKEKGTGEEIISREFPYQTLWCRRPVPTRNLSTELVDGQENSDLDTEDTAAVGWRRYRAAKWYSKQYPPGSRTG